MPFVLDNSVGSGWLLENQSTAYSDAIAANLVIERAVAPTLLRLEYTNVLRSACKRNRLFARQAQDALRHPAALPVAFDPEVLEASQLLALALRYDLTGYDAAYLELGLRRQLPVANQDTALAEAARVAGVGVLAG